MSKTIITCCWVAGLFLTAVSATSQAGVSLDRTRLIITEKDTSASANLNNTSPDVPFLAQSWVENEHGQKINAPLMVLPPLQRINGGQKGIARVTKTAGIENLPKDRESLFYLNVREIPPKPSKPNVLQLAMQSRIKLFYRPAAVIPGNRDAVWQGQVIFHKKGSQMQAENPTPYYITIISLSRAQGNNSSRITKFPGIMIAPKSSMEFQITDPSINDFLMMYVNDYGGHPELKYRCAGSECRALPDAQQS